MEFMTIMTWVGSLLLVVGILLFVIGIFTPAGTKGRDAGPAISLFRLLVTNIGKLLNRAIAARTRKMRLLHFGSALIQLGFYCFLVVLVAWIVTKGQTDDPPTPPTSTTSPTATVTTQTTG